MTCEIIKGRNGMHLIACSRGVRTKKCQFCKDPAQYECDAPRPRKKSGHCDARFCEKHRNKMGDLEGGEIIDTIDYCPKCFGDRRLNDEGLEEWTLDELMESGKS